MTSARIPDPNSSQAPDSPPAGLSWQARLAMAGLVPASLVLAWGLAPRADLPITSFVGLLLVLLALGTQLVVIGKRFSRADHGQRRGR